ncbi:MAG: class I adenylate-forming enzyme family protein [Pseudonocardiaceae bacterium]
MTEHPLLRRLATFGHADAVVYRGQTYNYEHLLGLVDDWRNYLDIRGVRAGEVVALEGAYSPQVCAGLLALIERGAISIPLSTLPAAKRAEFLDVAQVEAVIGVDDQGRRHGERTGRRAEHELYNSLRSGSTPGLVLFSSGTTGRSKATVLDFDKVINRYGDPKPPRRILSFLSLDHIGGVNTLLHTLNQGGTVVTVAQRTPDAVFAAIAAHEVHILPTTPTFLNMVLMSGAPERHSIRSLELITYGTEPMPLRTLQRLKAALPSVRFKQTYGLSELGILPTRSKSDDTLWVKLGNNAGFEHKIVDGVLWVRSQMAMLGYLNAPAPFDDDGFFNTQDMVEADGEYVRILGRRSEIINVGGEKVYPSEVENVLLGIPNVADASVTGHPSHVIGMVVKATVQLIEEEDERAASRRVREYCRQRLEPFKVPAVIKVSTTPQHSDRFKKVRSGM